jgi:hypothetical protein
MSVLPSETGTEPGTGRRKDQRLVRTYEHYVGGTLYVVGRVGVRRAADPRWQGTEAVVVAEGAGNLLKGLVGRTRPHVSGATTARS